MEERIQTYWTRRAVDFAAVRKNELENEMGSRWREELLRHFPNNRPLKILDVGTGSGFFAILLAKMGHQVVAVDWTAAMLTQAQALAGKWGVTVQFLQMDAQQLDFPDGSFDAVVSRNLTWTLPEPEKAYREWLRVLRPGGVLLNFDADYANQVRLQDEQNAHVSGDSPYGHVGMTEDLTAENAAITLAMPASRLTRPTWDEAVLQKLGAEQVTVDAQAGQRLLGALDVGVAPLFSIKAVKELYKSDNISYWDNRAPGYSQVNQQELATRQHQVWGRLLHEKIAAHFPDRPNSAISVLDVGTGPGFFAILMAEQGYQVTAVDYTAGMLCQAKENAGAWGEKIRFCTMDAEDLRFPAEAFDVVISRNVTWNLPHPARAYTCWARVLKKGGLLLNFDANWYRYLYDEAANVGHLCDRAQVAATNTPDDTAGTDVDAMESLARRAPLSRALRPQWDEEVLGGLGLTVRPDVDIWRRVWTEEERVNNASTPMFLIEATKD